MTSSTPDKAPLIFPSTQYSQNLRRFQVFGDCIPGTSKLASTVFTAAESFKNSSLAVISTGAQQSWQFLQQHNENPLAKVVLDIAGKLKITASSLQAKDIDHVLLSRNRNRVTPRQPTLVYKPTRHRQLHLPRNTRLGLQQERPLPLNSPLSEVKSSERHVGKTVTGYKLELTK